MTAEKAEGSCLCGEVKYQITGNLGIFQYCHCSRCRKFTGSAHAANIIVAPDQFAWLSGEDNVGRYEVAKANHFATSFCKKCGSSLPWLAKSGKAVIVPAGSLDDHPGIEPMQNIFYGSKADWYEDASELPQHEKFPANKTAK
jgi:hypothetical protein